jgi:hypothetical protein
MSGNGGIPIDIGNDGVTVNDPFDGIVNHPFLVAAPRETGELTLIYEPEGDASGSYMEFYQSDSCHPTGFGEGPTFIGSTVITASISGGGPITSTATGGTPISVTVPFTRTYVTGFAVGNDRTSELGECIQAASVGDIGQVVLSPGGDALLLDSRLFVTYLNGAADVYTAASYYDLNAALGEKGFDQGGTSPDGTESIDPDEAVGYHYSLYVPTLLPVVEKTQSNAAQAAFEVCLRADGIVDPQKTVVVQSQNSGSDNPWIPLNTTFDGANLCAAVDEGGLFTLASNSQYGALAVELESFGVTLDGKTALLAWSTSAESGNAGFEIQHRPPGVDGDFAVLGFVDGQASSSETKEYRFSTGGLSYGYHVFRLRILDVDGSFRYTPEVEVRVELAEAYELLPAYPNPFRQTTTLGIAVDRDQRVRVEVFDVRGRLVAVLLDGPLSAHTEYQIVFDGTDLPSGQYVYRAEGDHFSASRSVTLVR